MGEHNHHLPCFEQLMETNQIKYQEKMYLKGGKNPKIHTPPKKPSYRSHTTRTKETYPVSFQRLTLDLNLTFPPSLEIIKQLNFSVSSMSMSSSLISKPDISGD